MEETVERRRRPTTVRVPAAPRRARILAIDDEPMLLAGLKRTMRDHDVVCLDNARDAITLLAGGEVFDLIFTDLQLPQTTGMDLYLHLADAQPEMARRVVFLTGGATSEHVVDFLASVANPCLEKPVFADDLRAFVRDRLATLARG
jgi:DNA-binding NtrC family response regulator